MKSATELGWWGSALRAAVRGTVRRPFDSWALACSQSSQKRSGKINIHTRVENISFVFCEDSSGPVPDIQSMMATKLAICHAN
jgi:hypothetical protein